MFKKLKHQNSQNCALSLDCWLKSLKYQVIKEKLTNKQTDNDVMNFKMRGPAQDSGSTHCPPRRTGATRLTPRTSTVSWKPTWLSLVVVVGGGAGIP